MCGDLVSQTTGDVGRIGMPICGIPEGFTTSEGIEILPNIQLENERGNGKSGGFNANGDAKRVGLQVFQIS